MAEQGPFGLSGTRRPTGGGSPFQIARNGGYVVVETDGSISVFADDTPGAPILRIRSGGTAVARIALDSGDGTLEVIADALSITTYLGGSLSLTDTEAILIGPPGGNVGLDTDGNVILNPAGGEGLGTFGATPVTQQANIPDPSGGAVQDAESRTAIAAINALLQAYGLEAP